MFNFFISPFMRLKFPHFFIFYFLFMSFSCDNNNSIDESKEIFKKEQFNKVVKYINKNYLSDSNYLKLNSLKFVLEGERQIPKELYFEDENLYNFMNNNYIEIITVTKFNSKCDSEFTEIDFILDEEERNKYYQYSFCEIESTSSVSGKTDCYKIDENWMFCTQY